jgi:peptidoglycan/LPS O-acetylase OafA/YrhL
MVCLLYFLAPPDFIWRLLLAPLLPGALVLAWAIWQRNRKAWFIGGYAYGVFALLVLLWFIAVDLNMVRDAFNQGTPGFPGMGVALQLLLHLSILSCYGVLYFQPSVRCQFRKKEAEEEVA